MATFLFDHTHVTFLDAPRGVDLMFTHDGKTYQTVGSAVHSCRPPEQLQTYQCKLICLDDPDFEGVLYFDIIEPDCDDEADVCEWREFDAFQL